MHPSRSRPPRRRRTRPGPRHLRAVARWRSWPRPAWPSTSGASTARSASCRTRPTPVRSPSRMRSSAARSATDAEAEGRDVLDPQPGREPDRARPPSSRRRPNTPRATPGDPVYLTSGVLITSGGDVRVAVQSDVTYTFGRVVGLGSAIDRRPGAGRDQGRPVADRRPPLHQRPRSVRRRDRALRRERRTTSRTSSSTANTSCLGSTTDASLRSTPNPGAAFNAATPDDDPANHGPIIALVGQGATPSNAASFRGFVALDIRNFQFSRRLERLLQRRDRRDGRERPQGHRGRLGRRRLPGPGLPAGRRPARSERPGRRSSTATRPASSSTRSTTATTPAPRSWPRSIRGPSRASRTSHTVPSTVTINTNQNRDNAVTMNVTKNAAFTGVVQTLRRRRLGRPGEPVRHDAPAVDVQPQPAHAGRHRHLDHVPDQRARRRASTRSGSRATRPTPSCSTTTTRSAISIGNVNRDFSTSSGGDGGSLASTGSTGTGYGRRSARRTPTATFFGGTVKLSIEGGADAAGVLPSGIGAVSVSPSASPSTRAPARPSRSPSTAARSAPGDYSLTLRVTGTNSTGQPVTRLVPFTVTIATASTVE